MKKKYLIILLVRIMSSKKLLEEIKDNREPILFGEIGALLHDLGKYHPKFIESKAANITLKFEHQKIDEILGKNSEIIKFLNKSKIKINDKETKVYDIIRYHHFDQNNGFQNDIVDAFIFCDGKNSADDKGIVREKQPINKTIIASPFGFKKERISLGNLSKGFSKLEEKLEKIFKKCFSKTYQLKSLRNKLMKILEKHFNQALGETRIPANDVTLWDHSYSTAGLFKTLLTKFILEGTEKIDDKPFRIIGFCWNGTYYINKGKKIADILIRKENIKKIKGRLKNKFEYENPIGNMLYEDLNGIYFTFPNVTDEKVLQKLAKECAEIALSLIEKKSNDEIYPFFTLSEPTSILAKTFPNQLQFALDKRNFPKMSPILFIGNDEKENSKVSITSQKRFNQNKKYGDKCPVCNLRTKSPDKKLCEKCNENRKGRISLWKNRSNTIWFNEIADNNNRIVLYNLSFNLNNWLNGNAFGTIYSQSIEEWLNSRKDGNPVLDILKEIIDNFQEGIKKKIKSKSKIIKNGQLPQEKEKKFKADLLILKQLLEKFVFKKEPNISTLLHYLILLFDQDNLLMVFNDNQLNNFRKKLLKTFFEEKVSEKNIASYLKSHPQIKSDDIASQFFSQNPSPARIYRVWKETEEFFELVSKKIRKELGEWTRLEFKIYSPINAILEKNTLYSIQIKYLKPESLIVFHSSDGEFYTSESLTKFSIKDKKNGKEEQGLKAIRYGLREIGIHWISAEETLNKNLLKNSDMRRNGENWELLKTESIKKEQYSPFIEISKSSIALRVIIPAENSAKILEQITKLYNERFEKVLGKLPLKIGILASKRKFPLYMLLEASEYLFSEKIFDKPVVMDPWWQLSTDLIDDKYFNWYPTENHDNSLKNLEKLSSGKAFILYPGYFDFEFLLNTTDRFEIGYKSDGKRANRSYQLLSNKAFYLHFIPEMNQLWQILSNGLSKSQIFSIEKKLISKISIWRNVSDVEKNQVLKEFATAVLRNAFRADWAKIETKKQRFLIESAINGFLLDTIDFFEHTIKGEIEKNEVL